MNYKNIKIGKNALTKNTMNLSENIGIGGSVLKINNKKRPRRWKIIQKGKVTIASYVVVSNGLQFIGMLVKPIDETDKIYIKSSGKWIEYDKSNCYFIPLGYEYKVMGLRD